MKDWHLCLGSGCARDNDFEEFNCADPIETADPMDQFSLGPGLPGCELGPYCEETGMYELPCEPVIPYEGSAEVIIDYSGVDPTGLIPSPHDHGVPVYEVNVPEYSLPYVD